MTDHDTPGQRVYLVRLACGDGKRTPMPQKAFATLVKKKTPSISIDGPKVSRLEVGEQEVDVADSRAIAAVDPQQRGPAWIIFGEPTAAASQPSTSVTMTPEIVAGRGSPAEPIERKKRA